MKLRTEIERTPLRQLIGCREGVLLLGSCFTDHIGTWLADSWLPVVCNPWGVLFNPLSIAMALQRVLTASCDDVQNADSLGQGATQPAFTLHELNGRYYSFDHHGRWSDTDPIRLQQTLQQLEAGVVGHWQQTRHVIVTLGTSWVYEREGRVVANCHKFPAQQFVRRRLSVEEIVTVWSDLIEQSDKHFVFTVSPIRHVKDTLHGNQLSKATLLLAVDALCQRFPERVEYLPVYELLVDDLRDYRFYADDLVHPSSLAVEAVKELVTDCALTPETATYLREASPIVRALQHRSNDPESAEYQRFKLDTLQRKDALLAKYRIPAIDFDPLNLVL